MCQYRGAFRSNGAQMPLFFLLAVSWLPFLSHKDHIKWNRGYPLPFVLSAFPELYLKDIPTRLAGKKTIESYPGSNLLKSAVKSTANSCSLIMSPDGENSVNR